MREQEGGGASRTTDPAHGTSQATDVSLREYLMQAIQDSRRECRDNIRHLEKHFDEVQRHNEEVARENMADITRRFDGVNEFRESLSDLSRLMATKEHLDGVVGKLETLVQAQSARLTALERRFDVREGQQAGSRLTYGAIAGLLAATATVIGIIVVVANWLASGGP
jgi:ferritin-like metal-binding protein YciE